jgi:protein TonB
MENKKTEKADLENKKAIFFQVGLVLVLGLTLFAFEWKTYDIKIVDQNSRKATEVMEEIVLQTQQNTPPPPPPPQQQNTVLEIVENDEVIENEVSIDAEADEKTVVEEYHAPTVTDEKEVEEAEIFTVVEESPSFPGGDEARIKFLQENIKYPTMARESGIQGTVYVTFVVEKGGNVSDVKILRGIGGGCDEEAIRVIRAMPKWNPGKQRGKSVRVQFNMPIKFTLAG